MDPDDPCDPAWGKTWHLTRKAEHEPHMKLAKSAFLHTYFKLCRRQLIRQLFLIAPEGCNYLLVDGAFTKRAESNFGSLRAYKEYGKKCELIYAEIMSEWQCKLRPDYPWKSLIRFLMYCSPRDMIEWAWARELEEMFDK